MEKQLRQNARILILLPAYNEGAHLDAVLKEVKKYAKDILVVDDGSADDTGTIALANEVNLLTHKINMGKGQSLKDGYAWAIEHGYDAVVMLDSDGQHSPTEIDLLIKRYHSSEDKLVIGARNYAEIPLRRRIPNTIGRALISWGLGRDIPDNQSGFRLLDKDMMTIMLDSKESGFQFEVEMIAQCIAQGWSIGWVPISVIYNQEKSEQKAVDQILEFPKMVLRARRIVKRSRNERK